MSTVRIQVRRGTASQWQSINPILAAGEMGLESDTNYIKFGDGTQNWNALGYANEPLSALENTLADYVLLEDVGQPNGVASLNSSGKVPSDQIALSGPITMTGAFTSDTLNAGTINATTTLNAVDANITGNLTVSGTTTSVNSTNLSVQDPLIQIAKNNNANVLDLGIYGAFNDGTLQHTGLVKDATDGKWKLFSGVANAPTTTVNFSTYTKDNLEIDTLYAEAANIGNISDVELQYLNGVSSNIQSQLNAKASTAALSDHASDTTSIHGIADTSVLATHTYVTDITDNLAPKESPTFTGTVSLPSGTSIGNVSSTEIGYLDGVTSSIQTQLGNKASSSSLSDHTSATTSIHGIADTADLVTLTGSQTLSSKSFSDAIKVSGNVQISSTSQIYLSDGTAGSPGSGTLAIKRSTDSGKIAINANGSDDNIATESYIGTHTSATTSVHGIADTSKLVTTDASSVTLDGDLVVDGDFTVNGTNFAASATTITIEDNMVQLAHSNSANTVDLGVVVAYNESGTAYHAGIVRDVSDSKWKLFKDVTTEPTTTVDFSQGSLDDLAINNLTTAGVVFTDGTQTKEGVPSRTPIISKTGSYTLTNLSERDSVIEVSSTSGTTITIPTNSAVAYPVGTSIDIFQINTGQVTIAGDTGVTVNATPGLKLRTQWSTATLFKRDTDTWIVYGDLMA